MCDVVWCGFEQDGAAMIIAALIGLAGGVLALIAAIVVGLRQATILQEQSHIQREMVSIASAQSGLAQQGIELENLKIRSDLFARRFEVYEHTRGYIGFIIRTGHPPAMMANANPEQADHERSVQQQFLQSVDLSRFLFKPGVHERLRDEIWKPAAELHFHNRAHEGPLGDQPDSQGVTHAQKAMDLHNHFAETANNLVDIFGDELRLSD